MDAGVLYADTRGRITELVGRLSAGEADVMVPATPGWRVRDVVAHLSGAIADILAGNLDGVATEQWTAAQVDARRDTTVGDVLDEWSTNGPQVEGMAKDFGSAGVQLLMDCVTHEHDIRGALSQPGARESEAADASLQWLVNSLGDRIPAGLRLVSGNQEWIVGPGDPAASVIAPNDFDLWRALIGRRSAAQVSAWNWDGDPMPYLAVWAPWSLRADDLVE